MDHGGVGHHMRIPSGFGPVNPLLVVLSFPMKQIVGMSVTYAVRVFSMTESVAAPITKPHMITIAAGYDKGASNGLIFPALRDARFSEGPPIRSILRLRVFDVINVLVFFSHLKPAGPGTVPHVPGIVFFQDNGRRRGVRVGGAFRKNGPIANLLKGFSTVVTDRQSRSVRIGN